MSNGMLIILIKEKTTPTEKAGTTIINSAFKNDLNKMISIKKIAAKTKDIVSYLWRTHSSEKLSFQKPLEFFAIR